jgi:DNA-binding SARP family transcriptional activator
LALREAGIGSGSEFAPKLSLLRGFSLRHRDKDLALQPAGERLVAFLAVQSQPVQRIFVAGTLWIDASEERANASLRTTLWRLGRIGGELVRVNGQTLALAPSVRVDLREAQQRARCLIDHPEEHCRRDIELLGSRGELLPDYYDDWVLIERERFRELRVRALESLSRSLTNVGNYALAAEAALAAVACEPLRESAHRALMIAYIEEGNRADALRQYDLFRDQLRRSLDIAPSERMEMLAASVRHRDRARPAAARAEARP